MSKIDFIEDFKSICGDIEFTTEYVCKITSENIITDRVNIGFKPTAKRTLIGMANQIFDNTDKINDFINKIYDQYEDKIHKIYFGYAGGYKELYLEIKEPYESSNIISYDETNDKEYEYILSDISDKAKELVNDIFEKTGLIIPSVDTYSKVGYVKNNTNYFMVSESLNNLAFILKEYCKHINPNIEELETFLQEHSSNILNIIGYKNENGKISLNIYIKQQ